MELVDDQQGGPRFQIRSNGRECALPDMIVFESQADSDRFTIWIGEDTVTLRWDEVQEFLELWQGLKEDRTGVGSWLSSDYTSIGVWQILKVIWRYAKLR